VRGPVNVTVLPALAAASNTTVSIAKSAARGAECSRKVGARAAGLMVATGRGRGARKLERRRRGTAGRCSGRPRHAVGGGRGWCPVYWSGGRRVRPAAAGRRGRLASAVQRHRAVPGRLRLQAGRGAGLLGVRGG
jgi:hypothetical protein